ncbi:hypothetical protein Cob_v010823 [Colletotrichum orbiculare MAFF 240422]|uniref:Uncharacterized protein n=1 Tax=Colletotrichum orbiculare (strain 104-T / ATCC 96160 / CBS 514.97 / LARS 414 / MAFF 240422) TaxID=1213857 RepID=A0A484FH55_COLOR|nr:hypothetical protein Cob_v010823 [Colletotrichum orbiculare MAFF 240422]
MMEWFEHDLFDFPAFVGDFGTDWDIPSPGGISSYASQFDTAFPDNEAGVETHAKADESLGVDLEFSSGDAETAL